jgi:hypothetical protein
MSFSHLFEELAPSEPCGPISSISGALDASTLATFGGEGMTEPQFVTGDSSVGLVMPHLNQQCVRSSLGQLIEII